MLLGGKIDDESRIHHSTCWHDKHFSRLQFFATTSSLIGAGVLWKCLLELQRNAFPHYANAVYSVDKRFCVCFQKIAGYEFDHQ